jgi:hypothetical protein
LFIVLVANLLAGFTFLIASQPVSHTWDRYEDGTCINMDAWYTWVIILNCVTDRLLLILSIWMLRPLGAAPQQNAAFAAILGLGGAYISCPSQYIITDAGGPQSCWSEHLPRFGRLGRLWRPGLDFSFCEELPLEVRMKTPYQRRSLV